RLFNASICSSNSRYSSRNRSSSSAKLSAVRIAKSTVLMLRALVRISRDRARNRPDPVSVGITGHFQMLPHYLDADARHGLRQIQPVKAFEELFDPALDLLAFVL